MALRLSGITRQTPNPPAALFEKLGQQERITRGQALRMYTAGPAWLQFSEKTRGSLEPGKLADAVVIDRSFLTCPEDEIRAIVPLMTIVGGSIVYDRRKFLRGAVIAGFGTKGANPYLEMETGAPPFSLLR